MHCPVKEYRLLASCTRSNFTVIVAVLSGKLTVMGEVTTTSESRNGNIKGKNTLPIGQENLYQLFLIITVTKDTKVANRLFNIWYRLTIGINTVQPKVTTVE
jgi:hypothetical protein